MASHLPPPDKKRRIDEGLDSGSDGTSQTLAFNKSPPGPAFRQGFEDEAFATERAVPKAFGRNCETLQERGMGPAKGALSRHPRSNIPPGIAAAIANNATLGPAQALPMISRPADVELTSAFVKNSAASASLLPRSFGASAPPGPAENDDSSAPPNSRHVSTQNGSASTASMSSSAPATSDVAQGVFARSDDMAVSSGILVAHDPSRGALTAPGNGEESEARKALGGEQSEPGKSRKDPALAKFRAEAKAAADRVAAMMTTPASHQEASRDAIDVHDVYDTSCQDRSQRHVHPVAASGGCFPRSVVSLPSTHMDESILPKAGDVDARASPKPTRTKNAQRVKEREAELAHGDEQIVPHVSEDMISSMLGDVQKQMEKMASKMQGMQGAQDTLQASQDASQIRRGLQQVDERASSSSPMKPNVEEAATSVAFTLQAQCNPQRPFNAFFPGVAQMPRESTEAVNSIPIGVHKQFEPKAATNSFAPRGTQVGLDQESSVPVGVRLALSIKAEERGKVPSEPSGKSQDLMPWTTPRDMQMQMGMQATAMEVMQASQGESPWRHIEQMGNTMMGNTMMGNAMMGSAMMGNAMMGSAMMGNAMMGNELAAVQSQMMMMAQSQMPAMSSQLSMPMMSMQTGPMQTNPEPSPPKASPTQTPGEADNTLYALAQVAEEAAQLAVSAAAFCANPGSAEPAQVSALAEAATQAEQRAQWAATTMSTYKPPSGTDDSMIASMKEVAKRASEAAEQAAQSCRQHASVIEQANPQAKGDKRSKVPCKFWVEGRCWKGNGCEFSHEDLDTKPRPLMLKRAEECTYFVKGQCTRGVACPFAHGAEELAEISRYVVTLKREKQQLMRYRR